MSILAACLKKFNKINTSFCYHFLSTVHVQVMYQSIQLAEEAGRGMADNRIYFNLEKNTAVTLNQKAEQILSSP